MSRGARITARLLALGRLFIAERDRWSLWLAPALGLGIGFYFELAVEPGRWLALGLFLAAAALLPLTRSRAVLHAAAMGLAVAAFGFDLAVQRTAAVAAPVLGQRLGPVPLEGRVVSATRTADGLRLVLDRLAIEALPRDRHPERVRLTLRPESAEVPAPGDRVALRAILLPPVPPQAPGAYDFPRHAWYLRLGAIGTGFGPLRVMPAEPGEADGLELWINGIRQELTRRILERIEGPAGAIAAALITGDRAAIPAEVNQAMQDSGLAHILSISGLHLALVAGAILFMVRTCLALIEPLAVNWPIKKWAAVAALAGSFGYLLLSGAEVPAQRAFVMIAIVLLAVICDRHALSMRLVAWAAGIVLVLSPESLLEPGFQMSFAAVVALIAAHEALRDRVADWRAGQGLAGRALLALAGVALTTLVAGTATAPFALFHFNRFVDYSLVANLLAVPLISLAVMPLVVLSFLLMPFGLEALALVPMGWAIEVMIGIAAEVASWPGAVVLLPQMPDLGLLAVTIGGLWLCLWRRSWRLAGLIPIAIGLCSPWLAERPDVLVDGEGRLFALRLAQGGLAISPGGNRIARETWLRRDGALQAAPWPAPSEAKAGGIACDLSGCTLTIDGRLVALAWDRAALEDDCGRAALLVSALAIGPRCSTPVVVDGPDLRRAGAHAIFLQQGGAIRIETVAASRGDRPWAKAPSPSAVPRRTGVGRTLPRAAPETPPPIREGRSMEPDQRFLPGLSNN